MGKRHHRSPRSALLSQPGPVVNEQDNPANPRKATPRPSPFRGRGKPVLGRKPNSPLCGDFWPVRGRVGERHHRSPESALLGLCDPAVDESRGSSQPQARESRFRLHSERGWREKLGKAEKEKSRPIRACKGSALKHGIGLDGKGNFTPLRGWVWGGLRAAHIFQTLTSKTEV